MNTKTNEKLWSEGGEVEDTDTLTEHQKFLALMHYVQITPYEYEARQYQRDSDNANRCAYNAMVRAGLEPTELLRQDTRIVHGDYPYYWVCPQWVAIRLEEFGYEIVE